MISAWVNQWGRCNGGTERSNTNVQSRASHKCPSGRGTPYLWNTEPLQRFLLHSLPVLHPLSSSICFTHIALHNLKYSFTSIEGHAASTPKHGGLLPDSTTIELSPARCQGDRTLAAGSIIVIKCNYSHALATRLPAVFPRSSWLGPPGAPSWFSDPSMLPRPSHAAFLWAARCTEMSSFMHCQQQQQQEEEVWWSIATITFRLLELLNWDVTIK